MKPTNRTAVLAAGVALALTTVACGAVTRTVLPRHENSLDIEGERVEIRMLTAEQLKLAGYETDWKAAFPSLTLPEPSAPGGFAAAAPIAVAAVGLAIDFAKKKLEEEATLYEAQFSKRSAFDGFYIRASGSDEWHQNYFGFRITRTTARFGTADAPAFELVCGIGISKDGKMFGVAPLSFVTRSAKAKVLSYRWWSTLWTWLLKTGNEIQTSTQIEIQASWLGKDRAAQSQTVASFPVEIGGYELASEAVFGATAYRVLRASGSGDDRLETDIAGWFAGVPMSEGIENHVTQAGTFAIRATTTEKDPSKAKQLLEKASEAVEGQRERIIKIVREGVGGDG